MRNQPRRPSHLGPPDKTVGTLPKSAAKFARSAADQVTSLACASDGGTDSERRQAFPLSTFGTLKCSLVISRQVLETPRRRGPRHRLQRLYQLSSASKAVPAERACPITKHIASPNAFFSDMPAVAKRQMLFPLRLTGDGRGAAGATQFLRTRVLKRAGEFQQKRLFCKAGVTFCPRLDRHCPVIETRHETRRSE